jgi:hypothetical protein
MHEAEEHFTDNQSINDDLNEILAAFPELSRSRMRRKIREDIATLRKLGTDDAEAQTRHTFREFLVGWQFFQRGYDLEYNRNIGGQTPDWCDESEKLVIEVFTCERGGTSDVVKRVVDCVRDKVGKYGRMVAAESLHFVVAIHGDFLSLLDDFDCQTAAKDGRLFGEEHDLSGVVFFAETNVVLVPRRDGSKRKKQLYRFRYFPNPLAACPIDLTEVCG